MKVGYDMHPLGDQAVLIEFSEEMSLEIHERIKQVSALLEHNQRDWLIEIIPAFTTITVIYDPIVVFKKNRGCSPFEVVCDMLDEMINRVEVKEPMRSNIIDIPVCYEGELAPDLEFVAASNKLTTQEVIKIHTSTEYTVYMIGFAPGFPYLGGMSENIAAPRKETPRLKIPAGSVGIAGLQTGIYPLETPGGWQIIGRTPIPLFQPTEDKPSLLSAGDKIKFTPITYKEYLAWGVTD
ncbi:5-oxoprolinase subunit PxpB [Bacillus sp. PS06]|uniref:5-oxoprolinase subunit PxpB n=1 Tax=Bacillus sp. PS06 TaxID=2764176 RepID=UPI0017875FDC|nr:5-oxoprolinase subunit PxpB [Bacillus sp. PS06]